MLREVQRRSTDERLAYVPSAISIIGNKTQIRVSINTALRFWRERLSDMEREKLKKTYLSPCRRDSLDFRDVVEPPHDTQGGSRNAHGSSDSYPSGWTGRKLASIG